MSRGYSPKEILNMNIPSLPFEGQWADAFGTPGRTGVWIIWGNSGNGKSSFVMQLAKYLCRFFKKVAYDSLEEGTSLSLKNSIERFHMIEENGRFEIWDRKDIEWISEKLSKRRSPEVVIIDSFQYFGLTYTAYKAFKERHRNKLIIFTSHAEGSHPQGRTAKSVAYDADVKIFVSGFRAVCKGRFVTKPGNFYTIWEEGSAQCNNNI